MHLTHNVLFEKFAVLKIAHVDFIALRENKKQFVYNSFLNYFRRIVARTFCAVHILRKAGRQVPRLGKHASLLLIVWREDYMVNNHCYHKTCKIYVI